ncbi:DnaJ C-terminal domain-containing protein [Pseudoduganella sp. GCM10020061]|uniref:DnaJ C-terminal domain-containing protein n=1 Tax=Pseudoduganella sp. GCM10020061 TaxID=3317345 RepID=UPI0036367247
MEYKDYYSTLGVEKNASPEDIKKAYRKLVRKYHPDVSKEKDADARTKELNEAYDVLGDPEKRAAYDELGQAPRQGEGFRPPPNWGYDFDFGQDGGGEDLFADLFANIGRGRGARGGGRGFQMRGEDLHASISIGIREAYTGASHTISLRVPKHENGRITMEDRKLTVAIPPGVTPGQQLRLAGQGQPGSGGPGDLYLEIRFSEDKRFHVEGKDVYQTVPVAPWEAALGGDIEVETPSGSVSVNVPANSQTGRKLRLKGRGLPGGVPGNLYLVLEVVLPPSNMPKARELYEAMARGLATFNPRK